jgi:hypothetical protein
MTMLQAYAGTQTSAAWTTIKWLFDRYQEHQAACNCPTQVG